MDILLTMSKLYIFVITISLNMLNDYKIIIEIPVQWGDMDAAQHVNNVVYLEWVQAARVAFYRSLNEGSLHNDSDIGPILAWQECKYIKPVTYPDTVIVGIKKVETLEDRIITEAKIFSKNCQDLVAISRQQTVAFDFKLRQKAPLPLNWIYNEN